MDTNTELINLSGKDFEFLITPSDIEIKTEDFDRIMTPDSLAWNKVIKDDWPYYQVPSARGLRHKHF
jgi:hypothetical protein